MSANAIPHLPTRTHIRTHTYTHLHIKPMITIRQTWTSPHSTPHLLSLSHTHTHTYMHIKHILRRRHTLTSPRGIRAGRVCGENRCNMPRVYSSSPPFSRFCVCVCVCMFVRVYVCASCACVFVCFMCVMPECSL